MKEENEEDWKERKLNIKKKGETRRDKEEKKLDRKGQKRKVRDNGR